MNILLDVFYELDGTWPDIQVCSKIYLNNLYYLCRFLNIDSAHVRKYLGMEDIDKKVWHAVISKPIAPDSDKSAVIEELKSETEKYIEKVCDVVNGLVETYNELKKLDEEIENMLPKDITHEWEVEL